MHRCIWGGGRGGLGPPLEKLISLAGQNRELGRTGMEAWQDRNGSLAGQKWETWQKINSNTPHFESFSVIFICFLPLLVGSYQILSCFSPIFACFSAIFLPICLLAEQFCRTAWQKSFVLKHGRTHGPHGRKKFWQDEVFSPPSKMSQIRLCQNSTDRSILGIVSNI